MKLTKIKPRFLQKELKYIYVLESQRRDQVPKLHRHLPDGTYDLIINLGGPIYCYDDGKVMKRPDVIFIGGYKKAFHLTYSQNIFLVGIIFQPGYATSFIKDRLDIVASTFAPAEFIFGQDVTYLAEQLNATKDYHLIGHYVERFLLKHLKPTEGHYRIQISHAIELIKFGIGKQNVKEIAKEVCMSERNFRRVFTEQTGYSPWEMLKIIRTKRLIHILKNGTSITNATRVLGYYDSSHIIHDFRNIGGISPNSYVGHLNSIDQAFLKKSEFAL